MQNRFNIFVDDHSVPLDIFLHLPNYRIQEICKIIPTNLVLAASDLCPQTLFISVPECDIGHSVYNNNQTLTNRKAGINPYFDHLSIRINLLFSHERQFSP